MSDARALDRTTFRVWITKYALTLGILEREAEHTTTSENMVEVEGLGYFHGEGLEWHRTPEAAIKRAEQMRKAKIASLHKKLDKMLKMNFNQTAATSNGTVK